MKKLFAVLLSAVLLVGSTALFAACSQEGSKETIDVYAPDGAPALALAQLMDEEMQFGSERRVEYNVVAASTIQTYVQGDEPAELCVMPLNAAAQLLGKSEEYRMLGTVTHGNIYVLSAASNNYEELSADNLEEQLSGKTIGCIQLQQVVGLTLRIVLKNAGVNVQIIEDVSQATDAETVYLLNISDPSTMINPSAEYDYMVAAEPVVSAKIKGTKGALEEVGDLQELYGGEDGWPQAVLVAKTSFIEENAAFIDSFTAAMEANMQWLAAEDTSAQTVIDAIATHLPDGSSPTLTADNLTKDVIARCAIRFEGAQSCKEEVSQFLASLSGVSGQDFSVNEGFFFAG